MFLPQRSVKLRQFCCVRIKQSYVSFATKMGTSKMNRRDQELLDKQMRRLTPPQNDGAIAVMLAAMFLVGMALGSVLSPYQTPHQNAPTQIASLE